MEIKGITQYLSEFMGTELTDNISEMSVADVFEMGDVRLSPANSVDFVRFADSEGGAILGLEGGKIEETAFRPLMPLIHDWSDGFEGDWEAFRSKNLEKSIVELSKFLS